MRGPAAGDAELFGNDQLPELRAATAELSWLLSRGYPERASLKLVGDRHALGARQRKAVQRCACTDDERARRRRTHLAARDVSGRHVQVDAFNCVIIVESMLSGGVVLRGRDGAHRDLASVHGSWRRMRHTRTAIERLGEVIEGSGVAAASWLVDRPVSNSGRLAALLREIAEERGWAWEVHTAERTDRELARDVERSDVVATADAWVLDRCPAWVDLPAAVARTARINVWRIDLADE